MTEQNKWWLQANCRGMDTNLFFPGKGGDLTSPKEVCTGCVVRADCYEAGMNEGWGIWGGAGESHRRSVRRVRGLDVDVI